MPPSREIPTPDAFRFHCDIDVRFRDLDGMGHVNNAVYLTYFEVARAEYSRALGLVKGEEEDPTRRFPFILLEASCRFLAPIAMSDPLRVHMRTARFGTKSSVFEYLIVRRSDAMPMALGHTTQVSYDYAARRSVPVPDDLRATIEAYEGRCLSD